MTELLQAQTDLREYLTLKSKVKLCPLWPKTLSEAQIETIKSDHRAKIKAAQEEAEAAELAAQAQMQ